MTKKYVKLLIVFFLLSSFNQYYCRSLNNGELSENINIFKLYGHKPLLLNISNPAKVIIISNKTSNKQYLGLNNNAFISKQNDSIGADSQWNLTITLKNLQGEGSCYFDLEDSFTYQIIQQQTNLRGQKSLYKSFNKKKQGNFEPKDYLQLKEGVNFINSVNIKRYIQHQFQRKALTKGFFTIICTPKIDSLKLLLINGFPQQQIAIISTKKPVTIRVTKQQIQRKIYKLIVQNNYGIRFIRKKGFPLIKIFQCTNKELQCYKEYHILPKNNEKESQLLKQNYVKFKIESMLTKNEQFMGKKCSSCELFLSVDTKQNQTQVQIIIQPASYVMDLVQNQILKQDLMSGAIKKYKINIDFNEQVRINIQVHEGNIHATVRQAQTGNWAYQATQTQGIISIQLPTNAQFSKQTQVDSEKISKQVKLNKKLKQKRQFFIQIRSLNKDATYSIVYSSGNYQIYIKDGYPTSHVVSSNKNMSFFYQNQQIKNAPIYLSLNINNTESLDKLNMKIYCQNVTKQSKQTKIQYLTKNLAQKFNQVSSIVIQIPGNYERIQISFFNELKQAVVIAITINDEQIMFLPLNHNMPLQIDKNGKVNLLIQNNEEGFIELTIKKCDQSFPKIAYSLNPQDFMKNIYDYESLGQSQRIMKSTIKIKKSGGIYISISGDEISNSFIQIYASYIKADRKRIQQTNGIIKRGGHGKIDYQLLTNSKVQIWFQQVQCSKDCHQYIEYTCYMSTDKSDLYRQMMCPGIFVYNNEKKQKAITSTNKILAKPASDGIIAFKQTLSSNIAYLSIKAKHILTNSQLIYKDVEIVTFSGQIGRMSISFLFITFGTVSFIAIILFSIVRSQARMGYQSVSTSENQRKSKTKTQNIQATKST